MGQEMTIQCANCGTLWTLGENLDAPSAQSASEVVCPVCYFPAPSVTEAPKAQLRSVDDLENHLRTLVDGARSSGVSDDEIMQVLREELTFMAELAHAGRHIYLQIIDLGPHEGEGLHQPEINRRALLQSRSVGS